MLELFSKTAPLSLYIHIPFCRYKCAYCNFYSIPFGSNTPVNAYFERLIAEAQAVCEYFPSPFTSVYIGGGTPNLRENFSYLTELVDLFLKKGCGELSVECELSSLEAEELSYLSSSATRLSLGVQSLDADVRQRLCRFEPLDKLYTLLEERKRSDKFPILNLDFITLSSDEDDFSLQFKKFVDICDKNGYAPPEHISLYALEIEDGGVYDRLVKSGKRQRVDDEKGCEILEKNWELLESLGYEHYEISAFARAKNYCRHNLNYWKLGQYIALGAGAASRAFSASGDYEIYFPDDYRLYANSGIFEGYVISSLSKKDVASEMLLSGLRTKFGVDIADFELKTGLDLLQLSEGVQGVRMKDGRLFIEHAGFIMAETYIRQLVFRAMDAANLQQRRGA